MPVRVRIGIENDIAMRSAVDDTSLPVVLLGSIAEYAARYQVGASNISVTPRSPEMVHGGRVADLGRGAAAVPARRRSGCGLCAGPFGGAQAGSGGSPALPPPSHRATGCRVSDGAKVTECDDSVNFCAVPKILRESGLTLFQRGCYSQRVPIGRGFEPAGIVLGSSARSASTQPKEHTSSPLGHVPQVAPERASTLRL